MKFNPSTDIPDLSGKVIFVTGGTGGIGKASVLALAKHNPQRIYFSGRDSKRAADIIADINSTSPSVALVFLECDQGSLASVEKAAKQIISESPDRLDIVICNAGIMNVPPALTKEGYEVHFGVNHLAHALFIKLLLPTLLRTAERPNSDVRIVTVTSQGYLMHPYGGILFDDLRTTQGTGLVKAMRYGQSKLANILYAAELARRFPQITSVSIHPGVVRTDLLAGLDLFTKTMAILTNPFSMMTPAEGAHNQLFTAAGDKAKIVNGEYYEPVGVPGTHGRKSRDKKVTLKLWEWTEKELSSYTI
ncbi:oxidoreductase [Mycena vulgaris]|nr:oxidoreductase [Mycena vulgaris]